MRKTKDQTKTAAQAPVELDANQLEAINGGGDAIAAKTGDEEPSRAICNGVSVLAYARVDGESL